MNIITLIGLMGLIIYIIVDFTNKGIRDMLRRTIF